MESFLPSHTHTSLVQAELDLPSGQILGLFIRVIRKFVQLFNSLEEDMASATLALPARNVDLQPLEQSVDQELVHRLYMVVNCMM